MEIGGRDRARTPVVDDCAFPRETGHRETVSPVCAERFRCGVVPAHVPLRVARHHHANPETNFP